MISPPPPHCILKEHGIKKIDNSSPSKLLQRYDPVMRTFKPCSWIWDMYASFYRAILDLLNIRRNSKFTSKLNDFLYTAYAFTYILSKGSVLIYEIILLIKYFVCCYFNAATLFVRDFQKKKFTMRSKYNCIIYSLVLI